jgi:hypothetical protein
MREMLKVRYFLANDYCEFLLASLQNKLTSAGRWPVPKSLIIDVTYFFSARQIYVKILLHNLLTQYSWNYLHKSAWFLLKTTSGNSYFEAIHCQPFNVKIKVFSPHINPKPTSFIFAFTSSNHSTVYTDLILLNKFLLFLNFCFRKRYLRIHLVRGI